MSKWMRLLLSLAIALILVRPAPAAELTIWDFTLTYAFDTVGVATDYQVSGLYSHTIDCASEWELVSTVTAPVLDSGHVITYKASYSEGRFRIIERKEGTQTVTTLQCPSFSLVPVKAATAGWYTVCSGTYCPGYAHRTVGGIAPGTTSMTLPTGYLGSACVCAEAAQSTSVGIPYTGIADGILHFNGFTRIYRYAYTGTMVGGVPWGDETSGRQSEPVWPKDFILLGRARGPFGFGEAAGTWRAWWNN